MLISPAQLPRMYRVLFITSLVFLFTANSNPVEFRSPVNGSMRLSGTFGELRHNHFHAGIDIKSKNGRAGDPIFAVAEGYVSRIRMSASGYGNAVYIDHPNGYTTVYGHLENFSDELTSFIRIYQQRHQTFEVEIYPYAHQLKVKKGEIIGRMGNTGSSGGVHLHFEVRNTKTESPINPLHWDFNYKDDQNPFASYLHIYKIEEGPLLHLEKKHKLGGAYHDRSPYPSSIKLPAGNYGLGVKAIDPFNSWMNRNGIYSISVAKNDSSFYHFSMDSIPFHLSGYINTHIDHHHYCDKRSRVHRLFRISSNKTSIYKSSPTNGVIHLQEGDTLKFQVSVADISGRTSDIHFSLIGTETIERKHKTDSLRIHIPLGKDTVIQAHNCSIQIPENAFFEAVDLSPSFQLSKDSLPVIDIPEDCQAIYKGLDYHFELPDFPNHLKSKAYLGKWKGHRIKDFGGRWTGNTLSSRVKELGTFSVFVDTIPPKINYLYGSFRANGSIIYRITNENLSSFRHIDLGYAAFVNDEWCFASFDKRSMRMKVHLPDDFDPEKDVLTIKAWDRLGNTSEKIFPS